MSPGHSPFRGLDELDQVLHFLAVPDLLLDSSDGLGSVESRLKEKAVGAAQALEDRIRNIVALQANGIETVQLRPVSLSLNEWGDILIDPRAASYERVFANTTKLMHATQAAHNRVIFDGDMASQGGGIGENHMVTQETIVGNMGICHDQRMIADDRFATSSNRRPVDGGKLPDNRVITYEKETPLTLKLEILWLSPQDSMGEDPAPTPDLCPALDHDMGANTGPVTDADVLSNNRVWTDRHSLTKFGGRGNDRRGMHMGGFPTSRRRSTASLLSRCSAH